MKIRLLIDNFTNNEYTVDYADKRATFTILDEEYSAAVGTADIKRMICTIQTFAEDGSIASTNFASLVVAFSNDEYIGITTENAALRGKLMTKDTMSQCLVELYE